MWNGSRWFLQPGEVNFVVLGGEETTAHRDDPLDLGGQFLRGVRILDGSGVDGLLWKRLRRWCGEVVRDLLAVGGQSAVVDAERWLVVG